MVETSGGNQAATKRGDWQRDRLIDFSSNDYLALRDHPHVLRALTRGGQVGSGASPVLSGYTSAHHSLETLLAEWTKRDSALVFSSGYACNLGIIASLAGPDDLILSDQLNHASIIDGCRLARAQVHVYPHADSDAVDRFLSQHRHRFQHVLIVTESVFSMDGDLAPLSSLCEVACRYDAALLVDEAHAVGVYGEEGAGLLEELGLNDVPLVKTGTLSKAIGAIGGYAVGDTVTIEYLVNHCRSYLFSTAPAPAVMNACRESITLIRAMGDQRQRLRQMSRDFRQQLASSGLPVSGGDSPVVPIVLGDEKRVLQVARHLRHAGFLVPAIRPPTVPAGTCRLRISLSVRHSEHDMQRLAETLVACINHA